MSILHHRGHVPRYYSWLKTTSYRVYRLIQTQSRLTSATKVALAHVTGDRTAVKKAYHTYAAARHTMQCVHQVLHMYCCPELQIIIH